MMQRLIITGGPSREDLFDGLRLFAEQRKVNFTLCSANIPEEEVTLSFRIKSIEIVGYDGNSWNIQLNISVRDLPPYCLSVAFRLKFKNSIPVNFKANYSTQKRSGEITFEED
jgi:hypothetical protein